MQNDLESHFVSGTVVYHGTPIYPRLLSSEIDKDISIFLKDLCNKIMNLISTV